MARVWTCTDAADARESIRVANKLFGYPRAGTNIGAGIHVDLTIVNGPGWTLRHCFALRNTSSGAFAMLMDQMLSDAIVRGARLTAGERAYIQGKRAAVSERPEWDIGGDVEETDP